jgi:hypothetical protein
MSETGDALPWRISISIFHATSHHTSAAPCLHAKPDWTMKDPKNQVPFKLALRLTVLIILHLFTQWENSMICPIIWLISLHNMDPMYFLGEEISGSITPLAMLLLFVCNWSPAVKCELRTTQPSPPLQKIQYFNINRK